MRHGGARLIGAFYNTVVFNVRQVNVGKLAKEKGQSDVTGHNVRYVLLIGTLGVIVLFAVVYLVTRG